MLWKSTPWVLNSNCLVPGLMAMKQFASPSPTVNLNNVGVQSNHYFITPFNIIFKYGF